MVDRGVTSELAEQYGEMAQFPLMGQAIVMAYNLPTFNTSDPSLVLVVLLICLLSGVLTANHLGGGHPSR